MSAPPRRILATTLIMALTASTLLACGDDESDSNSKKITVWSLEDVADRVTATKAIIADFTAKTGIQVDLVTVNEDQFPSLIAANAAAGDLPDVVGSVSLAGIRTLAGNELLHASANAEVVDKLGRQTFSPRALELTSDDGKQLSVPSDGWGQLLVYRKDLFAAAGLPAPDTYERITAAAARLNTGGVAGITAATAPSDVFTQQTFEHLALANDCQLSDDSGKVTLDSPQCVEAFRFYGDLIRTSSVKGAQDVDTTRATYFAGKAAMVIWSPFILDELAGLRNDAKPTCPQCQADPAFLAKNSGFVTAIKGPNGTEPAQYGEISSWAVLDGAAADPAKSFVEYMLSDGYPRWFGMSPEGRFPVRKGTPAEPEAYLTAVEHQPGRRGRQEAPRRRVRRRGAGHAAPQPGHVRAVGPQPGAGQAGRRHARRAAGARRCWATSSPASPTRRPPPTAPRRTSTRSRRASIDHHRARPRPLPHPGAAGATPAPTTDPAPPRIPGRARAGRTDPARHDRGHRHPDRVDRGARLPAGPAGHAAQDRPVRRLHHGQHRPGAAHPRLRRDAVGDADLQRRRHRRVDRARPGGRPGRSAGRSGVAPWSGRPCCCRTWRRWSR